MKRGRGRDMSFVALRYNITKIQSKKKINYDILDVINMKFYALKSFIEVPNYQKLHIASS